MLLPKVVGYFVSSEVWTVAKLENTVKEIISNLDINSFLLDVEKGIQNEDDIVLISYSNNASETIYVFLDINNDGELNYGIALDYDGEAVVEEYVSLGDEEGLLKLLHDVLLGNN